MKSSAEILFEKHLAELRLAFQREVRFHPERKWRLDFVLTDSNVAVEVEGGTWSGGRHTRGAGYQKDLDKYNQATIMGYRVLRFSTQDIMRGRAKEFLKLHIGGTSHARTKPVG